MTGRDGWVVFHFLLSKCSQFSSEGCCFCFFSAFPSQLVAASSHEWCLVSTLGSWQLRGAGTQPSWDCWGNSNSELLSIGNGCAMAKAAAATDQDLSSSFSALLLQLLVLLQPLQLCSAYSHTCWLQASAAAKAELLLCHRRRPNKNPPTIFTLGKIISTSSFKILLYRANFNCTQSKWIQFFKSSCCKAENILVLLFLW